MMDLVCILLTSSCFSPSTIVYPHITSIMYYLLFFLLIRDYTIFLEYFSATPIKIKLNCYVRFYFYVSEIIVLVIELFLLLLISEPNLI